MENITDKINDFSDKTSILPFVFADKFSLDTDFLEYVCIKTINCYENNGFFKVSIHKPDPRPYYERLVKHWFETWEQMKTNDVWRKKNGLEKIK